MPIENSGLRRASKTDTGMPGSKSAKFVQSSGAPPIAARSEPSHDCTRCDRLRQFVLQNRQLEPDWHNGPVPTWMSPTGDRDVRLLIVGLAPGLRGANRTGRPFTGDHAGELLYETLTGFGLAHGSYGASADDGLSLNGCAITNAVRCVPPGNKPVGAEINNCRDFLRETIGRFGGLRAIVTLGKIAHESTLRALGVKPALAVFRHGGQFQADNLRVFSSYHCSRYNTNTGRLTPEMFRSIFREATDYLERNNCSA
jgi:uracil-DNA glycosylase family 4